MQAKRFSVLLLVLLSLSACTHLQPVRPVVQSPQLIGPMNPPPDPAVDSRVRTAGEWCLLSFEATLWKLCNMHYHRPVEHGRPVATEGVLPPCAADAGTNPDDWVEIHYAYVKGRTEDDCPALRERALHTPLGECLPADYIVRTVWARVTPTGTFKPKEDALPDSPRYIEYDGSSTGDTGGKAPVYWKINRECLEITEEALQGVHYDPSRELQPEAPPRLRPRSTK
jgi:hypothetical protein